METAHAGCARVVLVEANRLNCQLRETAFRPTRMRVEIVGSTPLAGFRLLEQLRALHVKTRGIVLLDSHDRDLVVDAFRCGAHAVVFRDEPIQTLARCMHAVNQGQIWANSEQLQLMVAALGQAFPSTYILIAQIGNT